MDIKDIQGGEQEDNQPTEITYEPAADAHDAPIDGEIEQSEESYSEETNSEKIDEAESSLAETDVSPKEQLNSEADPTDPILDSHTPRAKSTNVARTVIGAICSTIPVATGIIAMIAALGCDMNSKYLNEGAAATLTVAAIASVVIPFICAFFFPSPNNKGELERKSLNTLLPLAASFYLAFHTLTNDLGEWGDAILMLSLVAVVFFAIKMFSDNIVWKILCAFGVFALGASIIALLYLDFNIELNSPFKLAVQFGAVALILGTIADARSMLSRIKAGWFIFFKSIASSLCLICCGLIFTAFARGFKILPETYFVLSILYACYAINSIAEIASLFILKRNSDFNVNT